MFEKFTERAKKVMALANQEAQRFNHEYIGTEHILLGILKEKSGVGAHLLVQSGIDLKTARTAIERLVKAGPEMVTMGKLPYTPRTKNVIRLSKEFAKEMGHKFVGSEHLVYGLLTETEAIAYQVLSEFKITEGNYVTLFRSVLGDDAEGEVKEEERVEEEVQTEDIQKTCKTCLCFCVCSIVKSVKEISDVSKAFGVHGMEEKTYGLLIKNCHHYKE